VGSKQEKLGIPASILYLSLLYVILFAVILQSPWIPEWTELKNLYDRGLELPIRKSGDL
jgi:putative effector of murein hydrolase LrgA (UPF0299 family)